MGRRRRRRRQRWWRRAGRRRRGGCNREAARASGHANAALTAHSCRRRNRASGGEEDCSRAQESPSHTQCRFSNAATSPRWEKKTQRTMHAAMHARLMVHRLTCGRLHSPRSTPSSLPPCLFYTCRVKDHNQAQRNKLRCTLELRLDARWNQHRACCRRRAHCICYLHRRVHLAGCDVACAVGPHPHRAITAVYRLDACSRAKPQRADSSAKERQKS